MKLLKLLFFGLLQVGVFPAMAGEDVPPSETRSIAQLEQRLESIDTQLEQLANYSLRTGFGSVGYASKTRYSSPKAEEWVQVDLGNETPIDQIVLVPSIGRNSKIGFRANAFPLEFKVLAGTGTNGQVVASFSEQDQLLPRIAPLVVSCSITASWVRVETSLLSQRIFDENYDLKFAEIMVFNGSENMALKRPVKTSSQIRNVYKTQQPRFLTDGFLPYLLDSGRGPTSVHSLSEAIGDNAWMSIDLGKAYPLNRIHLHSVSPSHTAPLDNESDYYIPRSMRIEGALKPDFSDAQTLIEVHYESLLDVGPILMHPFPERICRYVRMTDIDPYIDTMFITGQSRVGFAEIELFSNGKNVAKGRAVNANFNFRKGNFESEALTDGLNFYGEILPVREWMNELALRHDLEVERPKVVAELNRLYVRQKTNLNRMRWLAIFGVAGIGITIFIDRMIRLRMVIKLRERIAANLHDELSANLHAVSLLGEMAKKNIDSRNKLDDILDRIHQLSRRSRNAARHCTNMLQADTACEDLIEEMKRSSDRLLIDTQHELIFEGEPFLRKLSRRKRVDLFLFYKECLINIARHAEASACSTRLTGSSKIIRLEVCDNGRGITAAPRSLKRRAHLLGARVYIETPESGGTRIILLLRSSRWKCFGMKTDHRPSKGRTDETN
ncbi:histidine kinase [Pontiellaceae bacterium B12219]|nr:histidine kinase [Pontiellaceae bacterium B12219]